MAVIEGCKDYFKRIELIQLLICRYLSQLYLHNNNLSYLDSHLLSRWDQLEVIDIRANPWMCDCDNQWLIGTLIPDIVATKPGMTENLK